MIEVKSGLNSRQWCLYNYLKERGDQWTCQEQIAKDLASVYVDDDWHIPFHDRKVRSQITKDIRIINESGLIQKIILSGARGNKIANEQEFDKYISSYIMAAVRKLKRAKTLAEKGNRNGQIKLALNGRERPIIEAFLKKEG